MQIGPARQKATYCLAVLGIPQLTIQPLNFLEHVGVLDYSLRTSAIVHVATWIFTAALMVPIVHLILIPTIYPSSNTKAATEET